MKASAFSWAGLLLILLCLLGAARFVYALTASAAGWSSPTYIETVYDQHRQQIDHPSDGGSLKRRWGPMFLLVMGAVTRLVPPGSLGLVLRLALVAIYALTVYWLSRLFIDYNPDRPRREITSITVLFVFLALQSTAAIYAISNGMGEVISAACVVGHFYFFVKRRFLAATLLICFGIYFKLYPIVFMFPYFVFSLLSRDHRKYCVYLAGSWIVIAAIAAYGSGLMFGALYPLTMILTVTTDKETIPLFSKEVFGPLFFITRLVSSFRVRSAGPDLLTLASRLESVFTVLLIAGTAASAVWLRRIETQWKNDVRSRYVALLVFQSVIGFLMASFSLDLSITLLLPIMVSLYALLWLIADPIEAIERKEPLTIGTLLIFALGTVLVGNLIPLSLLLKVLPLAWLDQLAGNAGAEMIPHEKFMWYQLPLLGVYCIALACGGALVTIARKRPFPVAGDATRSTASLRAPFPSLIWIAFVLASTSACATHAAAVTTPGRSVPSRAPLVQSRPVWGLSGQSNAVNLAPFLARHADVVGFSEASRPIDWWDAPSGYMWQQLRPTLQTAMQAFIWWQGESDLGGPPGVYREKLKDLVRRVRAENGRADLLVVVIRPGSNQLDAEQDAFIAADGHAIALETRDIGFTDGVHMRDEGYERVATRIADRLLNLVPPDGHGSPRPSWSISGQYNAERIQLYLQRYANMTGSLERSSAIHAWEAPDGEAWQHLAATLSHHLDAFIWVQGEADAGSPPGVYAAKARELFTRIRQANGNPSLTIAVVPVCDQPSFSSIRAEQAAAVAGDPHAVLVSIGELRCAADQLHMTEDSYQRAAARIAEILTSK